MDLYNIQSSANNQRLRYISVAMSLMLYIQEKVWGPGHSLGELPM